MIIQATIVGYLTARQSLKCLLKGVLATLTHNRKDMYAKYD
ncbi:DNA-binding protein, partial [Bacteroides xylanisolvens]